MKPFFNRFLQRSDTFEKYFNRHLKVLRWFRPSWKLNKMILGWMVWIKRKDPWVDIMPLAKQA